MASKGTRVISCQVTRKVEAGYKPSRTSEYAAGNSPKENPHALFHVLANVYGSIISILFVFKEYL